MVSMVTLSLFYSDRDFVQLPRLHLSDGGANVFDSESDVGPCCPEQNDDGQPSAEGVLLVSHALVGGDQDFVALLFSPVDQISVGKAVPPLLRCRIDGVSAEVPSEGRGRSVIKEYLQGWSRSRALSGNRPRVEGRLLPSIHPPA